MTTLPLVSVVIPAYNHGDYVDDAIRSVIEQKYPKLELIVIDDGSTDNTRDVINKYSARCHVESQPNSGQVATLNKGWRMSHGDILAYLSADDLLLPGAIEQSVQCLMNNRNAVLTYCDFNLIDPYANVVKRVNTPEFDYHDMVKRFICPPGPGAFFRRSAFEKEGGWNVSLKQMLDYEYWLRLGLLGRFVRIPSVLAAYRVHPGSQSFASSSQIRAEEPVTILTRYFERQDLPNDLRSLRRQSLSNAHLQSASLYFRTGKPFKGFTEMGRGFLLRPLNLVAHHNFKLFFNVLFYRIAHRALWIFRAALRRLARRESPKNI